MRRRLGREPRLGVRAGRPGKHLCSLCCLAVSRLAGKLSLTVQVRVPYGYGQANAYPPTDSVAVTSSIPTPRTAILSWTGFEITTQRRPANITKSTVCYDQGIHCLRLRGHPILLGGVGPHLRASSHVYVLALRAIIRL